MQDLVQAPFPNVTPRFEYFTNAVHINLNIEQLSVVQHWRGFDEILEPVGDQHHGIESESTGGPLQT